MCISVSEFDGSQTNTYLCLDVRGIEVSVAQRESAFHCQFGVASIGLKEQLSCSEWSSSLSNCFSYRLRCNNHLVLVFGRARWNSIGNHHHSKGFSIFHYLHCTLLCKSMFHTLRIELYPHIYIVVRSVYLYFSTLH